MKQRKVHVRHRCSIGGHKMQIPFERTVAMSGKEDRTTFVVVQIAITHCGTIKNDRVVQQAPISIRSLLQLVEEVRNLTDMVSVDLSEILDTLRITTVMGCRVERRPHAAVRPHTLRNVSAHLESGNSGDSGGEREHLQIEHQF